MEEKKHSGHTNDRTSGTGSRAVVVNRLLWMAVFLAVTAYFAWLEWGDTSNSSKMVWFMLTGLWSMVCGIGYTVMHWIIASRRVRTSNQR